MSILEWCLGKTFSNILVPGVREKLGNFEIGQENLKKKQKSGKSQGIL